jgi:hypothetical protein
LPGSWSHLTRRFLWSLRVDPLSPEELDEVGCWISGDLLGAFLDQSEADRRHGLDGARVVAATGGRHELVVAALVHDIGKRHARLGVVGRSLASALSLLRLPTPGRLGTYLDHGRRGADELTALGWSGLVVDFARSHHAARPSHIDPHDWDVLVAADHTVVGRGRSAG